jgi:Ca2+-binding EF-hand superfamily protein
MTASATDLKDCFAAFDTDNDGLITKKDLALCIRAMGKNPTEAEFKALLDEFGKSVEMIDFGMFKTAYGKKFKTPAEQDKPMRDAFKILDADNDGTITEAELRQMLLTVGEPLTHQEVDILMADVEVDVNGKVKYDNLVDKLVHGYTQADELN